MTDEHLRAVSRVYGPETWEVYDLLDRSLDPRGPEVMLDLAAGFLAPDSTLLDVGCRDASHLVELVRATGARGAGAEPLPRFVERARATVAEAGLERRVEIVEAAAERLPWPDGSFDVVWCRDVLELVAALEPAVVELARVLRPGGRLVVFTVLATDRLEPGDADMLAQNLAVVPANLVDANVEAAFRRAGLERERREEIGTEWREHAEERTRPASRDLLRLARLRRRREEVVNSAGEDVYRHVESNLHWLVFQFLGKLLPVVDVWRKPAAPGRRG